MTDLQAPMSYADLQALVDYAELAGQGETPDVFPSTAIERARWELHRGKQARVEYLRSQIRDECISYGELHELQGLAETGYIDPDDVELLEWAGVPEFPEVDA